MTDNGKQQGQAPAKETDATKDCFIIAPIPDPTTPEGIRADKTLRHLIRPIVREHGYEPLRADEDARPGMITTQVLQRVADADLVVADLTDHNANVFYELAIRHAMQAPVVQLISHDQRLPFDVAGMRAVRVDVYDPDDLERAREDLRGHIRALGDTAHPVETPLSVAQRMKQLWESKTPHDQLLSELASQVAALRDDYVADKKERARQSSGWIRATGEPVDVGSIDLSSAGRIDASVVRGPSDFTFIRDLDAPQAPSGRKKTKKQENE